MGTMVLIRGLPGSGKTTKAKQLVKDNPYSKYYHYEADHYFELTGEYKFDPAKLQNAHLWCQARVMNAMTLKKNVIVANTFVKQCEMDYYKQLAKDFGYYLEIIHCEGQFDNIHNVPKETVDRMRTNFEK
jgi:predicted kinase